MSIQDNAEFYFLTAYSDKEDGRINWQVAHQSFAGSGLTETAHDTLLQQNPQQIKQHIPQPEFKFQSKPNQAVFVPSVDASEFVPIAMQSVYLGQVPVASQDSLQVSSSGWQNMAGGKGPHGQREVAHFQPLRKKKIIKIVNPDTKEEVLLDFKTSPSSHLSPTTPSSGSDEEGGTHNSMVEIKANCLRLVEENRRLKDEVNSFSPLLVPFHLSTLSKKSLLFKKILL